MAAALAAKADPSLCAWFCTASRPFSSSSLPRSVNWTTRSASAPPAPPPGLMLSILHRFAQTLAGRHGSLPLDVGGNLLFALQGRRAGRRPALGEIIIEAQEQFRLGQALDLPGPQAQLAVRELAADGVPVPRLPTPRSAYSAG